MNIGLLNSYTQGISGGDQQFINTLKTKKNIIITSQLGKSLCSSNKIKAKYLITTKEKEFKNTILTYIIRTIIACKLIIPLDASRIHSSSDFIPDVLPAFLKKIFSPKIVWEQMIFHFIPKKRKISHIFQKISFWLIRYKADKIFVDNDQIKNNLVKEFHFDEEKIMVIKLTINEKNITNVIPSIDKYDAIFFGQLRESKGIYDLPLILKEVVKKNKNFTIALIGEDLSNNQFKLESIIRKNRLEKNFIFLGYKSTLEACSYIKSSKFVVIPSYEEGYGLAVRESLLCKTNVLVYDLPAFSDIKNKKLNRFKLGEWVDIANFIKKTL